MADPTSNKETTVIGGDTHIKGEMSFKKSVRVVGTFEGKIAGEGELQVADNATCRADVDSNTVIVDGTVEGNLVAKEKVQLNAKGVIKGDIVAGKMVMTEGASFFGQCSVGADAVKQAVGARPSTAPGHTVNAPKPGMKPGEVGAKH